MCDPMVGNEDILFATAQAEKQGVSRSRKERQDKKLCAFHFFLCVSAPLRENRFCLGY
jgi:hypothetical protein